MKGVVFNIFEKFVVSLTDEDTYESILESTELQTQEPFVGPGTYPDADLLNLVQTTSERLNIPVPDAVEAFGKFMIHFLKDNYSNLFADHTLFSFLESVDCVVHVEVKKLMVDSVTPKFETTAANDALTMSYYSERKLCALMVGLVKGAAEIYGEPIELDHKICYHNGDDHCELVINKVAA